MHDLDELFSALARSKFRSRFRLDAHDIAYLHRVGQETVLQHGRDFLQSRLAPAAPKNDGRQTPLRGHPIFVAQHATGACCRGCVAKWHGIAPGEPLAPSYIEYLLSVLRRWLEAQAIPPRVEKNMQRQLFES